MKISKVFTYFLESNTRIIPVLGVLVLALAVPITLNLIEQNQDNRQQASQPPVSMQNNLDPGGGGGIPETCADLGGQCINENQWASNPESCFAGNVNENYTCSTGSICCIQLDDDAKNQTCEGTGKTCDYNSIQACETAVGVGNCTLDSNSDCFNNNLCLNITNTSVTPSQSPSPSQFPPQGAPCPDGSSNFSCGFGTSDTQCPVCSPTSACTSNNYSIASCSTGSACTTDADCTGRPSSCPAGTTGAVACIQNICQTINCQ